MAGKIYIMEKNDKQVLKAAEMVIENFLAEIIKYMPRTQGNNWEICKMHKQLHVAKSIIFYGVHHNVHTGSQEHNHIDNTKKPSKQVQRKKLTLEWNLAKWLSENMLLIQHTIG